MTPEEQVTEMIDSGRECTPDELTPIFDALEPVEADAMLGAWRGGGFETTSQAAGMLEKMRWHGKRFNDAENVEPLLCRDEDGNVYSYEKLGMARLRSVSFRGRTSAAMVYDTQPIIDVFRRIDEERVLGLMDVKGAPVDYYFHLTRGLNAATMRTAVISDLHLGSGASSDLLRRPEIVASFLEAVGDCDRIVLLGDTIELRDRPIEEAMELARPFFEEIAGAFDEVVLVPGNHDHRLLGQWLERVRDGERAVGLSEEVASPHHYVEQIASWVEPSRLEMRYPGIWIRDDVYATHGHYLDSHITLPTVERLSIASIDRMGGRPTGRRDSPQDYEKLHAPVYDLLFNLAQGARNPGSHKDDGAGAPSMRLWEMLGGASGRARNWRGRILRSAVVPATLSGLERAGWGRFSRDFSLAEIGRSGVEAMHVVVDRLGIEADHVLFGHIHRRGPLTGEDGRGATDPPWERRGTTLHNTGCWLYVEGMLGKSSSDSPFWPGRALVVGESGDPEVIEVLAETSHAELAKPTSAS